MELKENKSEAHKNFAKLLKEDLSQRVLSELKVVKGTVGSIGKKFVEVDINGKANGYLSVAELQGVDEFSKLKCGDTIEVFIEKHDASGETLISRSKVIQVKAWEKIQEAYDKKSTLKGKLIQKTRGGYITSILGVLAFCPGSQISNRALKDFEISTLINKEHDFRIMAIKKSRGNIVCSRKEILIETDKKKLSEEVSKIKENQILKNCSCRGVTSWGAFFSYGNIQLLVHVNELSHSRVTTPSELISVGSTHDVKVIKIEGTKVSGSIKRLSPDPFLGIEEKIKPGQIIENCRISSILPYGAFVEIAPNLTGLCHGSQIDHLNKNPTVSQHLAVSQLISVKVLEVSEKEKKISLSYKDTFPSPWVTFREKFKVSSICNVKLKSSNSYGLWCLIDNSSVIGMCHINNIVHNLENKEEAIKSYKKGDTFKAKIISISDKDLKVQLSIKDLEPSPFQYFLDKKIDVNSIVTSTVHSIAKQGIWVYVGDNKKFKILINRNELGIDNTQNLNRFSIGTRVDCMVTSFQPDHSKISLSIKKFEQSQQKTLLKKYGEKGAKTGAVLGDLLKAVISSKEKKNSKKTKK